jgi:uncharacterized protein YceK
MKATSVVPFVFVAALAGCSTISTVKEREPRCKIYSGTRLNFSSSWVFVHVGLLDWPFSLVADTIALPYTIPKTIRNFEQPDEEWESGGHEAMKGVSR